MAAARAETTQHERERKYAASFNCLVEQSDSEELKSKPKEKCTFVDQKREETDGMVCGSRWVSMFEMWKRKQIRGDAKGLEKWRRRHVGGHDLVRRMDRQGEVLIWCRKCSGYARQRMGPFT